VNSTEAGSLVGGLAVLDKDDQVAGLELVSPLLLCSHAAWKTQLTGILWFRVFIAKITDYHLHIVHYKTLQDVFIDFDPRWKKKMLFKEIE